MQEDKIKEAFLKVKEDINSIKQAINIISEELELFKRTLEQRDSSEKESRVFKNSTEREFLMQTQNPTQQTDRQITPTVPYEIEGLKTQNFEVSIGNDGVPTDRQTNQQTDKPTEKFVLIKQNKVEQKDPISHIDKVSEMLESLDTLKKELRLKFKKLTNQEMLIFSTLYQLEDQGLASDYKLIANKTNLSESSIRDYILKIIKKGIPVDKIKENNKKITLSIPQNLRRIASLKTILTLREL